MKNVRGILLAFLVLLLWVFAARTEAQPIVAEGSSLEEVTSGYQFTEGPYWHPDGFLLFSDIPANTVYKWTPGSKESKVFKKPSGHSNGITAGADGQIILAQHDGKISRMGEDGSMVVLADSYKGKRLNSPNDVTVASDGIIYFTDPPFGVDKENRELSFSGVFMLRPDGKPLLQFKGFSRPNGIVLSPDESKVYVNDSETGRIIVFERKKDGSLTNKKQFADVGPSSETGAADGMVVDRQGRLYSSGPEGVTVFSPGGEKVEVIDLPAQVTNAGWGGLELKTLYFTTPATVYRLKMGVKGYKK